MISAITTPAGSVTGSAIGYPMLASGLRPSCPVQPAPLPPCPAQEICVPPAWRMHVNVFPALIWMASAIGRVPAPSRSTATSGVPLGALVVPATS